MKFCQTKTIFLQFQLQKLYFIPHLKLLPLKQVVSVQWLLHFSVSYSNFPLHEWEHSQIWDVLLDTWDYQDSLKICHFYNNYLCNDFHFLICKAIFEYCH